MNIIVLWLILAALFLVIELVTIGMVSIWFLAGAVAALIAAALGAALWLQIVLFVIVTGLCFALLYPRLNRLVKKKQQPTNADMALGQTCVVVQRIDNVAGTGAETVGGKTWTARTRGGETVNEGELVRAEEIQGVKLIVSPLSEN